MTRQQKQALRREAYLAAKALGMTKVTGDRCPWVSADTVAAGTMLHEHHPSLLEGNKCAYRPLPGETKGRVARNRQGGLMLVRPTSGNGMPGEDQVTRKASVTELVERQNDKWEQAQRVAESDKKQALAVEKAIAKRDAKKPALQTAKPALQTAKPKAKAPAKCPIPR